MPGDCCNARTMTAIAVVDAFVKTACGARPETRRLTQDKSANGLIAVSTKVKTMTEYEFELHFALPDVAADSEHYLDALYEAGCDDAVIGLGQPGYLALDFCRSAKNAESAVKQAVKDVKRAIPHAMLITAAPDLLNISDLVRVLEQANVVRLTRQAMRKYAFNQVKKTVRPFPGSQVFVESPLWHLDEVIQWLLDNDKVTQRDNAETLLQIAHCARELNASLEYQRLAPDQRVRSIAALALG